MNRSNDRRYFTPESEARTYALQAAVEMRAALFIGGDKATAEDQAKAIVEAARVFEEYLAFEWEDASSGRSERTSE